MAAGFLSRDSEQTLGRFIETFRKGYELIGDNSYNAFIYSFDTRNYNSGN